MVRWTIFRTPALALMVHHFLRPDWSKCTHDHPWWFWTVVLWGGYTADVEDVKQEVVLVSRVVSNELSAGFSKVGDSVTVRGSGIYLPGHVYFRPAKHRHTITKLHRRSAWTLVLRGGYKQAWGFYTKDGWKEWSAVEAATEEQRLAWCDQ